MGSLATTEVNSLPEKVDRLFRKAGWFPAIIETAERVGPLVQAGCQGGLPADTD